MTAWKQLELRIAKQLGGQRTGPAGQPVSDITGTPWSVEIKRAKTSFRIAWIEQAQRQGKQEGKPWLLIVARHHDRQPIIVCNLAEFLRIARKAGLAPIALLNENEE